MKATAQKPRILVIDVGGTHVKVHVGGQREVRKVVSGSAMTAAQMVQAVKGLVKDWDYDVISIGYPGVVARGRPVHEPYNLGGGWVAIDFAKAFGRPVKIVNDAAMQALGSYKGGCMLFLGLGSGLGSAMIVDGTLLPMELGHLPYKNGKTYEDFVGDRALKRLGKKKWRRYVADVLQRLKTALEADYVMLGGGNSKSFKNLPAGVELGDNRNAFIGGIRLWKEEAKRRVTKKRVPRVEPARTTKT